MKRLVIIFIFLLAAGFPVNAAGPLLSIGGSSGGGGASAVQIPGPNAALFASPPYTCTTNFYVSTTGSSGNPGTQVSPWDIVSAFNTKNLTAGSCVNIADGTYTINGELGIHNSNTTTGSSATPAGYVVFRAYQTMNGPHIRNTTDTGNLVVVYGNAKYIWFDGLYLDSGATNAQASQNALQMTGSCCGTAAEGQSTPTRSSHHIYVTNTIVTGGGQAGIQGGGTEYEFVLYSTIYNNAFNQPFVLASGLSIYQPLSLQGYTPTNCTSNPGDCSTNKAMAYDSFWCVTGSAHTQLNTCYTIAVNWNMFYNNFNSQSFGGDGNSDGEGYEADDWAHAQCFAPCTVNCIAPNDLRPGCPFDHNAMTVGNVFYGNGSAGFEENGNCGPTTSPACATPGVTLVANNSFAMNGFDCCSRATFWGEIDFFNDIFNMYVINNIALSHNYSGHAHCTNCNYGLVIGHNCGSGPPPVECKFSGGAIENNIFDSVYCDACGSNTPTIPTTGPTANLIGTCVGPGVQNGCSGGPSFLPANVTAATTGAVPVPGQHDFRLCRASGNPAGCTGASPAIGFGQAGLTVWQQPNAPVDGGACVVNAPGPVATCPILGDALP